jgi:serine/threonine-protein kinase
MISGQTIAGKYRINQLLGSGGMASVWSATNIFTERQFAIKFMLPAVARTPEAARRFLMEAKVSARIDHPNIIEVIDVGQTEDGSLFLVMELLTGMSLETAIRRTSPPMALHEFVGVMVQVARALSAAHKSGVIHRDLKPTNVFLHKDREGAAVPKLLDFGVSKFLEEEGSQSLTIAGTVLGSPLYMSPEQAMGSPIDGRTDVFAFGAILFEAMCGYRAYDAPNFNALIVTIATTKPKQIDECAPTVPESLRKIVRECMVTDREKRLASFDEIAERLMGVLPELEKASMRLPIPARNVNEPLSDPDATNALPVVRASDRPQNEGPRSGNGPASGYSPWGPSGSASGSASVSGSGAAGPESTVNRRPRAAYFLGGASVAMAVALVALVSFRVARGSASAVAASPADERLTQAPFAVDHERERGERERDPAAASSAGVPVISIDSLPVAAKPSAAPEHGTGRLLIGASPGWCTVTVDGVRQGPTPQPALDLPTGPHQLRCEPPVGKTKNASVIIQDGATARYKFVVE